VCALSNQTTKQCQSVISAESIGSHIHRYQAVCFTARKQTH
jgi:hypothetical protein